MSENFVLRFASQVPHHFRYGFLNKLLAWIVGCEYHSAESWVLHNGTWRNVAKVFLVPKEYAAEFTQLSFLQELLSAPFQFPSSSFSYYIDGVYYECATKFFETVEQNVGRHVRSVTIDDTDSRALLLTPHCSKVIDAPINVKESQPANTRRFFLMLSFDCWSSSSGMFTIKERIYSKYSPFLFGWTPFVTVRKRYDSWFGFFRP